MLITLSFRKNLIYLFLLFIFILLRRILAIILSSIYGLDNSLIFCLLMFLGEFIAGLIIYHKQSSFLDKNLNERKLEHQLSKQNIEMKRADNIPKIILLIFFATFFDFNEFIILYNFIPKIARLSVTSTLRLCSTTTITSSILCILTLKYKIGKHQIFSSIILGIFLSTIITMEFIFKPKDINIENYLISYLLVFCHFIFVSFTDIVEKYLFDYNFLNPFLILMSEGIFGFILASFYSIFNNPFREIINIYNKFESWKFILLIVFLILYSIFSLGLNMYKILSNIYYSPMTKSLAAYLLNYIFIIYFFISEKDFMTQGKKNYLYFIVNLVLSVLIDCIALIYIEIIIFKFCGLDKDTHEIISYRATTKDIELTNNRFEDDDYFVIDDEKENVE